MATINSTWFARLGCAPVVSALFVALFLVTVLVAANRASAQVTECEADLFLASDPTISNNNYFGIGAIKGDLLVVSAAGNSPSGSLSQTGAFYIYNYTTQWELDDKYLPDDPQNGAQLGEGVATDGARIAFSEPLYKISNQQVGRVQVWHKPGSSWAHMDHLLPDDEEPNTTFAGSTALHKCVAINGDVVVVGAPDMG